METHTIRLKNFIIKLTIRFKIHTSILPKFNEELIEQNFLYAYYKLRFYVKRTKLSKFQENYKKKNIT